MIEAMSEYLYTIHTSRNGSLQGKTPNRQDSLPMANPGIKYQRYRALHQGKHAY